MAEEKKTHSFELLTVTTKLRNETAKNVTHAIIKSDFGLFCAVFQLSCDLKCKDEISQRSFFCPGNNQLYEPQPTDLAYVMEGFATDV